MLPDAVDLKKAKAYRIGAKDLITMHNCFSMAVGNVESILGIDKRSYYLPVPVTVMKRSIYDFCSEVSTIFLIMTKDKKEETYSSIFYEITNDIIKKADFSKMFSELIYV